MKRVFESEAFDIVHVHDAHAPIVSLYALYAATCPIVLTTHASRGRWWFWGHLFWHVLTDRIDYKIAVSEQARAAALPWLEGPIEVLPNGVPFRGMSIRRVGASTSSSSGGTSRARGLPSCCARGPRSHAEPAPGCA